MSATTLSLSFTIFTIFSPQGRPFDFFRINFFWEFSISLHILDFIFHVKTSPLLERAAPISDPHATWVQEVGASRAGSSPDSCSFVKNLTELPWTIKIWEAVASKVAILVSIDECQVSKCSVAQTHSCGIPNVGIMATARYVEVSNIRSGTRNNWFHETHSLLTLTILSICSNLSCQGKIHIDISLTVLILTKDDNRINTINTSLHEAYRWQWRLWLGQGRTVPQMQNACVACMLHRHTNNGYKLITQWWWFSVSVLTLPSIPVRSLNPLESYFTIYQQNLRGGSIKGTDRHPFFNRVLK